MLRGDKVVLQKYGKPNFTPVSHFRPCSAFARPSVSATEGATVFRFGA